MVQVAINPVPSGGIPLTNPVPGAWMQIADESRPPVYVPFEEAIDRQTGKPNGHFIPGAHILRILSEGGMYTTDPLGTDRSVKSAEVESTEAALRAQLQQANDERERMMEELREIREKMEADKGVPHAAARRR
jgi:hypothetical protein